MGADNLRYPLCLTAVGGIVGVFPIDSLSWTPETASAVETMTSEAKGSGATGAKTLVITGTATPLARRKLKALGWTLRARDKHV